MVYKNQYLAQNMIHAHDQFRNVYSVGKNPMRQWIADIRDKAGSRVAAGTLLRLVFINVPWPLKKKEHKSNLQHERTQIIAGNV